MGEIRGNKGFYGKVTVEAKFNFEVAFPPLLWVLQFTRPCVTEGCGLSATVIGVVEVHRNRDGSACEAAAKEKPLEL